MSPTREETAGSYHYSLPWTVVQEGVPAKTPLPSSPSPVFMRLHEYLISNSSHISTPNSLFTVSDKTAVILFQGSGT